MVQLCWQVAGNGRGYSAVTKSQHDIQFLSEATISWESVLTTSNEPTLVLWQSARVDTVFVHRSSSRDPLVALPSGAYAMAHITLVVKLWNAAILFPLQYL